ncbi:MULTISPECIES: hypothetical protein [unclassified Colwellia]|uniref:hypothetical protein n=1 Tax=unclassified Colwellia TaxID=196834 RepID=UPI0015F4F389|nr:MULTISPECIES: hypothetical protein [unclassified Colwellia]MBA6379295.1 hypothetical protein [Colwellia sp. BRX10-7]MBA6387091.1 hypothetical protein [Colwellia sp. BRX10-2]MBA6401827.1 hypothetical protein [Colwellia sp. BRX10-5]MBA6405737.1 hypothetical protein [Colwellia sp. BRX10-1]
MIRSLRKGQTSIEVWYKFGEDSIGAKQTEIELMDDHAVFRIKLAPVDGNQSSDANKIFLDHSQTITKVIIRDDHIRKNSAHFLNAYTDKISYVNLELVHNKNHLFSASLKPLDDDGLEFQIKT